MQAHSATLSLSKKAILKNIPDHFPGWDEIQKTGNTTKFDAVNDVIAKIKNDMSGEGVPLQACHPIEKGKICCDAPLTVCQLYQILHFSCHVFDVLVTTDLPH